MSEQWTSEENGTYAQFVVEDGKVHKRLFQPNRTAILKQNQEVKKSGTRRMDWGQQVAEIPIPDLEMLRNFFGDALFNPVHDKWDRKVAREAFLNSPASDPYRLEARRKR